MNVDQALEAVYRPRLVAEMERLAESPFVTHENMRPLYRRMAELFATKPWDEVVAVYRAYIGPLDEHDV